MPGRGQLVEAEQRRSTVVSAFIKVAANHGRTFEYQQLVRAYPFDGEEPTPGLLIRMAEASGFRARMVRIKRGGLGRLVHLVPAILLLPNGRAALLHRVQKPKGVSLALIEELEVESGLRALCDEPRLFAFWAGDVILLKLRWKLTASERPFGFHWLLALMLTQRRLLRDIAIAAFSMNALSICLPLLVIAVVDRVLANHSESTLHVLTGVVVGIIVFETLLGYLRRYLIWIVSSRIDGQMLLYVFDKLLNLPMSFFERMPTGVINSKLFQIWHIRSFMTQDMLGSMLDAFSLSILLPVLFFLNWKLACFVCVLAVIQFGVYVAFLPGLRRRYGRVVWAEHKMGAHQIETIHGIRTVKSLSLDGLKRRQRDLHVAEVVEHRQEFDRYSNFPHTMVTPLQLIMYGGTFLVGCYMAMSDPAGYTVGTVFAFTMLAARVAGPVAQLANSINSFEKARAAVGEVGSLINSPPEEGRSGTGLTLPITGGVVFQDVRFRYLPGSPYALDGVSFEIPQGTIFGVMGRSGSGKTTVTRLLQGLNRDYEGLIKIDGMDLREIDLDHLRANIGVVPQENFLFSGTVRDNISAGRPRASFDMIVQAAQLAGAEEFIERLPRGYDTPVQEGAANFSGGQRQRLAIARALLVDPPILILDEATSALDAESEAIVNENLLRIAQNRTVIIISHRLSALAMADAILVLERGRFYDVGPHRELIAKCDIYQHLWKQQNRHLELEGAK